MTDADLAELAGHLEAMRAAARDGDGHGVAEADARFHGRIVELADNGDARAGLALARAVLADVHHARRPGRGSAVVGRPPRPDPRGARARATPRPSSRPSSGTSTRSATTWPGRWPDDEPSEVVDLPRQPRNAHERPRSSCPRRCRPGPARLRVDVYGSEPIEHVLDDMSFLNYRLADVRIEPEVTLRRARHRLAPGRGEGHRLRRPPDDVQRPLAGRADPEGRRHDARAPDGVGRAAPVPRLGRPLPRPDGPVPRRRVEPRQVDGPDRGLPPRRAARVDRDDRHRRDGPGGRRLEGAVPQEAHRGHRARRQGGARARRREVLRRRCRAGRSTPSRATSTSSSSPRSTATSTRRAPR